MRNIDKSDAEYLAPLGENLIGMRVQHPKEPLLTGSAGTETHIRMSVRGGTVKTFICTVTRDEYDRRQVRHSEKLAELRERPKRHVSGCYRLFARNRPVFYRQIHRVCPTHFSLR